MARSTARKRALNTLYEADEKGQDILSLLSERLATPGAPLPLPEYAIDIVKGVAAHRSQLDALLNAHSETWQVRRMPVVDRNILRLAVWEIVYNDEVPAKVAIDEALQLAKKLSDYDAPPFMHGLLSAVAEDPEAVPEPEVSDEVSADTTDTDVSEEAEGDETQPAAGVNAESAEIEESSESQEPMESEGAAELAESVDPTEPVDPDATDLADINLSDFA